MAGPYSFTDLLKHQPNPEQKVGSSTQHVLLIVFVLRVVFRRFHEPGHKQHYPPDLGLQWLGTTHCSLDISSHWTSSIYTTSNNHQCERRDTDNVDISDERRWKLEAAVEYFKVDYCTGRVVWIKTRHTLVNRAKYPRPKLKFVTKRQNSSDR
jgi:hypothetical protein